MLFMISALIYDLLITKMLHLSLILHVLMFTSKQTKYVYVTSFAKYPNKLTISNIFFLLSIYPFIIYSLCYIYPPKLVLLHSLKPNLVGKMTLEKHVFFAQEVVYRACRTPWRYMLVLLFIPGMVCLNNLTTCLAGAEGRGINGPWGYKLILANSYPMFGSVLHTQTAYPTDKP